LISIDITWSQTYFERGVSPVNGRFAWGFYEWFNIYGILNGPKKLNPYQVQTNIRFNSTI